MKLSWTGIISFYCIVCACFQATGVAAQMTAVQGQVRDLTGEALMGAHVYVADESAVGTFSDTQGKFRLLVPDSLRADSVNVRLLGYETKKLQIKTELQVILRQVHYELDAVELIAGNSISEDFLIEKMDRMDIYQNPVSAADPLRSLITVPASTNVDESANPALRGASPEQSRVFINGVPIYKPVRNTQINGIGNFSLFHTEIVESMHVYASNPPLTRGNSTGGAVAIETTDEISGATTQASVGLAHAGVFHKQSIDEKKFLQIYSNGQFDGPFLLLNGNANRGIRSFGSTDAGLNLHLEWDKRWTFDLLSYAIQEQYLVDAHVLGQDHQAQSERKRYFHSMRIRKVLDRSVFSIYHGFDVAGTDFAFGPMHSQKNERRFYLATDWRAQILEKLELQLGTSLEERRYQYRDSLPTPGFDFSDDANVVYDQSNEKAAQFEPFIYLRYRPNNRWLLQLATRSMWWRSEWGQSYQASVKYDTGGPHSFLLALGQYHSTGASTIMRKQIPMQSSRQYALDYRYLPDDHTSLQVSIYMRNEDQTEIPSFSTSSLSRRVAGLEIATHQSLGKWWETGLAASYLLDQLDSGEEVGPGRYNHNWFFRGHVQFSHPQWLNASIALLSHRGIRLGQWSAGNQGQPSPPQWPFNTRVGDYYSLNLSLQRFTEFRGQRLLFYCNVNNALNRENPAGLKYDADFSMDGYQLLQGRSFYFGVVLFM